MLWESFSNTLGCWLLLPKEEAQGRNGYLRSHELKNKVVLKSWNENEMNDAYRYLSDLISSKVDSEKPKHLYTISFEDDPEFSTQLWLTANGRFRLFWTNMPRGRKFSR